MNGQIGNRGNDMSSKQSEQCRVRLGKIEAYNVIQGSLYEYDSVLDINDILKNV